MISATTILGAASYAQTQKQVQIVVKDADSDQPLPGALIEIHDQTAAGTDLGLTANLNGVVTTPALPGHTFVITASADLYKSEQETVDFAANAGEVDFALTPIDQVITIRADRILVQSSKTENSMSRGSTFINRVTGTNPQSLSSAILTTPGIVSDSHGQLHANGEHGSTQYQIGGVALGGTEQGRFAPLIVPGTLENLNVITGSFAPEYGGETAAIVDSTIKAGTPKPEYGVDLGGGTYSERDGSIFLGGQLGDPLGPPNSDGEQAHKIWYFVNSTTRSTDNAIESPQPDDQTAHNNGLANTYLGRFDYVPNTNNQFTLTMNDALGETGIADRTGLGSYYAPYGQGYGFGGLRDQQGYYLGQQAANPNVLGSGQILLPNQLDATQGGETGVDVNQRDDNEFEILQLKHTFDSSTKGEISLNSSTSILDTTNGNGAAPSVLPIDSAYEFNPTVDRTAEHGQVQGSITKEDGKHTFKLGIVDDQQKGDETYNLIPDSQEALDALYNLQNQSNGLILAPPASKVMLSNGTQETDVNGNLVYTATGNVNTTTPVVFYHRSGYYRAGYAQDTFKPNGKFTANYGVRLDGFDQSVSATSTGGGSLASTLETYELSPRVNLSYAIHPTLIGRLSYNRLFTQPPIADSAILGQAILPQLTDMYEASIEKQLHDTQTFKATTYYKHSTHQIDTSLLIPGTQLGIFTSVNFDEDDVRALELSYDLEPRHDWGTSAFVSYTYSMAKPDGLDNTGAPVPEYNDHDQRNTVDLGSTYQFHSGATLGANFYYGSGVTSSQIYPGDPRHPNNHLDLSATTGDKLFDGHGGLRLDASNILNNTALLNFNSGFSGTEFEVGRMITVSAYARF